MTLRARTRAFILQFSQYGLIGILNTSISFSVIALATYSGINPFLSNGGGYAAGLLSSFFLNKLFTFNARGQEGTLVPFLVSFGICYLANLIVLYAALPLAHIQRLLPHLLGMLAYNVSFFTLMRLWVFKNRLSSER
jgi:putative flippase GtrA